MDFFETMKESISQKAKSTTESMRLNNQIKSNVKMIEKLTYQVGLQCVNHHAEESDSEYADFFREIKRLLEENQICQDALMRLAAEKICAQCGFSNSSTGKFCVSCGAPLPEQAQPQEEQPEPNRYCPECGTPNAGDAAFCEECGTHL